MVRRAVPNADPANASGHVGRFALAFVGQRLRDRLIGLVRLRFCVI
jgi:hypothetical protein